MKAMRIVQHARVAGLIAFAVAAAVVADGEIVELDARAGLGAVFGVPIDRGACAVSRLVEKVPHPGELHRRPTRSRKAFVGTDAICSAAKCRLISLKSSRRRAGLGATVAFPPQPAFLLRGGSDMRAWGCGAWRGGSIDDNTARRFDAAVRNRRPGDAGGDAGADGLTVLTPPPSGRARRRRPRPPRRARRASRSWRSCRSRASRSRCTMPTAGSCARRSRPAPRGRETPAGIFAIVEKNRTTARRCMTTPGCRICSASPGTASRCMAARCPATRPRMAACGCPTALPKSCSTRPTSGCG